MSNKLLASTALAVGMAWTTAAQSDCGVWIDVKGADNKFTNTLTDAGEREYINVVTLRVPEGPDAEANQQHLEDVIQQYECDIAQGNYDGNKENLFRYLTKVDPEFEMADVKAGQNTLATVEDTIIRITLEPFGSVEEHVKQTLAIFEVLEDNIDARKDYTGTYTVKGNGTVDHERFVNEHPFKERKTLTQGNAHEELLRKRQEALTLD